MRKRVLRASWAWVLLLVMCSKPQKITGLPQEYTGIGVEVTYQNSQLVIVKPLMGSPAAKAGLRARDIVLAINGKTTQGVDFADLVTRLRGPPGSQLTITIRRNASELTLMLRRTQMSKRGQEYKPKSPSP